MKLSPSEQESVVGLLTRIYQDICEIETEYQLLIGDGDFRPRIEYFHDAVRALTSQAPEHLENGGRLNVEFLNYDVSCLRYLQSMPLAPFTPDGGMQSPETGMVPLDHKLVAQGKRPDRKTRERLVELYQHYAVLFAALLKPQADDDWRERTDELNNDVKDINAIIAQFEKGDKNTIARLVQNLEEDGLRTELVAFLQHAKLQKREEITRINGYLKTRIKEKDRQLAAIEKAHMEYGLTQLAMFENAQAMLKKMASQGMNLVGAFVEASVAQTRREMGR